MTTPTPAPASPTFIDKLAYLHIKDRKLLMTRSHGKDTWYNAGGKREPGESDQAALIREVKEELTVDLIPETIRYYGTFQAQAHGKPKGTVVRLICYMADFIGSLTPSSEIGEIAFLAHNQADLLSDSGRLIMADLHTKGLID